jgi:hypothetical protein
MDGAGSLPKESGAEDASGDRLSLGDHAIGHCGSLAR